MDTTILIASCLLSAVIGAALAVLIIDTGRSIRTAISVGAGAALVALIGVTIARAELSWNDIGLRTTVAPAARFLDVQAWASSADGEEGHWQPLRRIWWAPPNEGELYFAPVGWETGDGEAALDIPPGVAVQALLEREDGDLLLVQIVPLGGGAP